KNKKKWTIGLELLKIFLIFLLISVLSYSYNCLFVSKVNPSFENLLYMFLYTSALGLPAAAIYVMARYIYMSKKNKPTVTGNVLDDGSALVTTGIIDTKESNKRLHIVADYGNFHFDIEQEDFVYAEAVDNYCFIHFYKNGSIQKEIIRISLTKLLKQIQTDAIKRVHRSFIVNLKKVTKFKGNASGYKISLEDVTHELIVSRSYIDSIIPVLKTFVVRP
ncbi:MAG TPA: LytTR family DNA-binding domain-containing protein, partial [Bacillales bacterium]|nr:LytTR family DNA-binding domain-containing protein [Bacillales bacterium]